MNQEEYYKLAYVVVDDDEEDRILLRLVLREANRPLPIYEFADGQAFIDYLTRNVNEQVNPDLNWLVVLDINMPRLNGIDTLKLLKKNPYWSKFPVLRMSTSDEPTLIQESYRNGANGYVTKPTTAIALVEIFDKFFVPLLLSDSER